MQKVSPRWHFLGFVHGASGHCIVDVPPPINAQTKMRLHTDEDHDKTAVVASAIANSLTSKLSSCSTITITTTSVSATAVAAASI